MDHSDFWHFYNEKKLPLQYHVRENLRDQQWK